MFSVVLIYALLLANLAIDQFSPPVVTLSVFEISPEPVYSALVVGCTTESDIERAIHIDTPEWTAVYKGDPVEAYLVPIALIVGFVAICTLLQWSLSDFFTSDLSSDMPRRESGERSNGTTESAHAVSAPVSPLSPTSQAPEMVSEYIDTATTRSSSPVRDPEIEPDTALSWTPPTPKLVSKYVDTITSHPPTPSRDSESHGLGIALPPSPQPSPPLSGTHDTALDTTEYQHSSFTSSAATKEKKTRRGKRGSRESDAAKASKTARNTRRKERRAAEKAEAIEEE
nr:hypothetical protein B0A51_17371 [Rachicladosporium sp. CCFEE 5018]